MLSLLDEALDRLNLWVKHTLAPRSRSLWPYRVPVGLLLAMPLLLFPPLAVGEGLHRGHWGGTLPVVLLGAMTLTGVVGGLFYGAVALAMFLALWRGKVTLPERKRARMKVNYFCGPFLYGLIAAWGVTALQAGPSGLLLRLNVAALLLWWSANLVLTLSGRRRALPSAA